ncbi:MAG: hypothetical protein ACRDBY_11625 [Cetobacterium sp.]
MELKEIQGLKECKTRLKISNKKNSEMIEQLKFIGAVPVKETRTNTYFDFNGDITKTADMLGLR